MPGGHGLAWRKSVELRHLRYFAAVADEGSMSRAADRLHTTQPSLSRQLKQLEREIGSPLFARTHTGTALTGAGVALHRHVQLLLRLVDAIPDMARDQDVRARELVNLGVPPGVPQDQLIRLLDTVRQAVPRAALSLTEASSREQLRLLHEGRLDLCMTREPPESGNAEPLFSQAFGVAVRPEHPLAVQTSCCMGDLSGLRVLAHSRQQVPVVDDQLVVAAHDSGAVPLWQFVQFSEYALAAAHSVEADAVLLIEHSARRLLPDWPWLPLAGTELQLVTWLVWPRETRAIVDQVARVMAAQERKARPR
ncbi:LysR family transcriptional regulator [Nocardioides sp. WG-D5]